MHIIAADSLHRLVRDIGLAAGADERNAECLADHLVLANLRGVDSHGIWHLARYVSEIAKGEIQATNWPEIVRETAVSALVSGNWTFGQTAARFATELAIDKAREQGLAAVGLVRSGHIGRLGHFVEMAAEQGCMAIVTAGGFSEVDPVTVPFGGRDRLLSTNPIAVGFPTGEGDDPVMFDFATTAISGVKVVNASRRGEPLSSGCIVDGEGRPTTDARVFAEGGAHVPFGGHKGYALNVAVEVLGRIFTGSDTYVQGDDLGSDICRHAGTSFLVIRADLFRPFEDFTTNADSMADRLRTSEPAAGVSEVLAPGDPESRAETERRRDGIPVADDIWESVVETANELGVTMSQGVDQA